MIADAPPITMPALPTPIAIVRYQEVKNGLPFMATRHHEVAMGTLGGKFPVRRLRSAGCSVKVQTSKSGVTIGAWTCPASVDDRAIIAHS